MKVHGGGAGVEASDLGPRRFHQSGADRAAVGIDEASLSDRLGVDHAVGNDAEAGGVCHRHVRRARRILAHHSERATLTDREVEGEWRQVEAASTASTSFVTARWCRDDPLDYLYLATLAITVGILNRILPQGGNGRSRDERCCQQSGKDLALENAMLHDVLPSSGPFVGPFNRYDGEGQKTLQPISLLVGMGWQLAISEP